MIPENPDQLSVLADEHLQLNEKNIHRRETEQPPFARRGFPLPDTDDDPGQSRQQNQNLRHKSPFKKEIYCGAGTNHPV